MTKKIRRVVVWLFVLIFLMGGVLGGVKGIAHAQEYSLPAKGMCVMETSSGRVLYQKNSDDIMPMASTTKIMTCITAIENCRDLDEKFEISPKSVGVSGTSIYLREGEVMSTRDLLYGLMLVSGNDSATAIACHVGGSERAFVGQMNTLARKIGAYNTHFDNPHGLDSKTHYTSAYDLALITSYALENPTFREIVATKNTKIVNEAGKTRYLKNKNKLLASLDGCCGVKTGYTDDAGRCLVSACERDGMRVVCVVLNCRPMFEESASLLERAFKEYSLVDLTKLYTLPTQIEVRDGREENIMIEGRGNYFYPLKEEEKEGVTFQINLPESLLAPIEKGQEIGEVKIFVENNLHFTQKIYTINSVRSKSIFAKIKEMIDKW